MREPQILTPQSASLNPKNSAFIYLILICVTLFLGPSDAGARPNNYLLVKVANVYHSPGVWSGIAEFDQWLDVTILVSSSGYTRGDKLHIGIPIVKGNNLFETNIPKFAKSRIAPGRHLRLKITRSCIKNLSDHEFIVDPICVSTFRQVFLF